MQLPSFWPEIILGIFFPGINTFVHLCVYVCVQTTSVPDISISNKVECFYLCVFICTECISKTSVSVTQEMSECHSLSVYPQAQEGMTTQLKLTEHDGFTTSTFRSECIIFFILKQQRISCSLPQNLSFSVHTHTESHTRSHTQTQTAKKNSRVYKILILYYQVMCTFDVITITEEIIQPSL